MQPEHEGSSFFMTTSTHRYCPQCGAANEPSASHCFACNHSLIQELERPEQIESSDHIVLHHLFKDRYYILEQLGTGGFGAVYKARDTQQDDRLVAIKEIRLAGLSPQEVIDATDAFNREVQILSDVRHPQIPRLYAHFTDPLNWYLVIDFIEGETIIDLRNKTPEKRLPIEQVIHIGIQVCSILEYLHSQQPPIIYRDIKPDNLIQTPSGTIFLIDFGVARRYKPGKPRDTIAFGSPGYAAPEQYGRAQTTARSDLYSLGATLHTLLTGIDPEANPFHFTLPELPTQYAELAHLIEQLVSQDSEQRPESAVEVKAALEKLAQQVPVPGLLTLSTRGVTTCIYRQHQAEVHVLSWSPDSKYIISAASEGAVHLWEANSGKKMYEYKGHSDRVTAIAWSPTGDYIASASLDYTLHMWAPYTSFTTSLARVLGLKRFVLEKWEPITWALAWSPDGNQLAAGGESCQVKIWDASELRLTSTYEKHADTVLALAWSPDQSYIASAGNDDTLRIWSPHTNTQKYTLRRPGSHVTALAWSPNSRLLAFGWQHHPITLCDHIGQQTYTLPHSPQDGVNSLTWSPDGRFLAASTTIERFIRVWDMTTMQLIYTYDRHNGPIRALAWSPDGRFVASGGQDKLIHIWQAH